MDLASDGELFELCQWWQGDEKKTTMREKEGNWTPGDGDKGWR